MSEVESFSTERKDNSTTHAIGPDQTMLCSPIDTTTKKVIQEANEAF